MESPNTTRPQETQAVVRTANENVAPRPSPSDKPFPFTRQEQHELRDLCQRVYFLLAPRRIALLMPCADRVEDIAGTDSLLYTPALGLVLVDHAAHHALARASAQNAIDEMQRQNRRDGIAEEEDTAG